MNFRIMATSLLLGGLAAACSQTDSAPPPPGGASDRAGVPVASEHPRFPNLPADSGTAVEVTIQIEGMPEVLPATVFAPPPDFPIAFSTVVPDDMTGARVTSAERDVIRFDARFGGVRAPGVAFSFVALPAGASEEAARMVAAGLASQLGGVPTTSGPHRAWAVEEYRLEGARSGFLALGEREGVWFYILTVYPAEYGDGIGPRVELILRSWIWTDDARPLVAPGREPVHRP